MGEQCNERWRHFLILLISAALIIFFSFEFGSILIKASKVKPPIEKVGKKFTRAEEVSFYMFKDWTQSTPEITILLLGAIWGFMISQKIVFTTKKNWSLWIAFFVPNICFGFEYILYTKSVGRFIEMFFSLEIITMEKGTDYFYLLPKSQVRFFLYGILTSIVFILLVLYFKKKEMLDLYRDRISVREK